MGTKRRANKVVVVGSASGSGKTTLARELAHMLDAPVLELDSVYHGPGWVPTPVETFRARVDAFTAAPSWVVDGSYHRMIGPIALERADLVVWLDLPVRVWLPRLLSRSLRRWWTQEELWNGNRESLRDIFWGREALVPWALDRYLHHRPAFAAFLAPYQPARLTSPRAVASFRRDFAAQCASPR